MPKLDLKQFSSWERMDMLEKFISKYPKGLTLKEMIDKTEISGIVLRKILKGLVKDNRIRLIDFGNAKVYKPKET